MWFICCSQKNIFRRLTIDWDCGWDKKTKKGATDFVLEMLSSYNKDSNLFDNYNKLNEIEMKLFETLKNTINCNKFNNLKKKFYFSYTK